jgi:sugar lactone lactonase YvrE
LGEGPVWNETTGTLVWIDILEQAVHRLNPASGQTTTISLDQPVGAVAPRRSGGLVAAVRDGFAELADDGLRLIAPVEVDQPENRMNDGKCDRAGRLWASTMSAEAKPGRGALYRLDADLTVHCMVTGLSIGNGLAWSGDDRLFYFIDSLTGGIDVFDFDVAAGTVANRRPFVRIEEEAGLPDGMCIDAEGCLWVALWGGAAVRRYSPSGDLACVVDLPVSNVTSCAFGGPGYERLFITTAAAGLSDEEREVQPHAGAVFEVAPGTAGLPPAAFAG